MKTLLLIFLALVPGCGRDDKEQSYDQNIAGQENKPKEEDKQDSDKASIYLESEHDLPACDVRRSTQLAYLKDIGEFRVCHPDEWVKVAIKGQDGKNGKDGEAGAKGDTGATGAQGAAGIPTTANQWFDTVASKSWLMGATVVNAYNSGICTGDYRLPTETELSIARQRGLEIAAGQVSATACAWVWNGTDPTYFYIRSAMTSCAGNATTAGHYCIKN